MSKNHDIDSTRQIVLLARNAGIGIKPGLVLAILQGLEETRAKHRKEWGRAEKAERDREEYLIAYEAAEAKLERVRELVEMRTLIGDPNLKALLLRALDGGDQT